MDFETIERLMRMLETSELNELDVREGALRIRLSKAAASPGTGARAPEPASEADVIQSNDDEAPAIVAIRSGMAGTFYRSPSPGAPPFTQPGEPVRDGDQLAIIEAMKTLNPVEAACDGIVHAIHAEDGASVEPGMILFEVEPYR